MNDFDKSARYLIKRDAPAFFRWLLRREEADFDLWVDARRAALPNQADHLQVVLVADRSLHEAQVHVFRVMLYVYKRAVNHFDQFREVDEEFVQVQK